MRLVFGSCLALTLLTAASGQELDRRSSLAPLTPKPERTVVTPDHDGLSLIVKFDDGSGVRLLDGHLRSPRAEVQAVDLLLDSMGAQRERMWLLSDDELVAWRQRGEARTGQALHDLTLFYRVRFEEPGRVAEACDALNAFDVVTIAYPVGRVGDPVLRPLASASAPAATPDFESLQLYRTAAPSGIDADYGGSFSGGQGTGVTIADVETGWTDDHEDIAHKALGSFIGLCCAPYPWDHGTAVLGELIGQNQGEGVKGIVHDADVLLSTHQGDAANIPTAIANAVAAAAPGDVVVLEVQCYQGPPSPHPCEWDDAIFATVQTATASGIHVFAAAGNGNNNLDSVAYGGKFDRNVRDSGSVIVGASNGILLDKAGFSNYGSRVDAHGWGFDVASAGYGDLYNAGTLRTYTDGFSGTSSATPIVTGAGIQLIGIYREVYQQELVPLALRDLLTATGTPQGSGGNIGPRPDVRAAIEDLNLPRIALDGDRSPGGTYTVTNRGVPGDTAVLLFATDLRPTPVHRVPYGYLFLETTLKRLQTGPLDGQGELVFTATIPAGATPGTTLGYFQNWQRFQNGQPGLGAFGNLVPLVVQ